jgi:hypothetical protein
MKYLLPFFIFVLLAGCDKEPCVCNSLDEQAVYFEYRYVNFAWGYREHGWLMDGEGVIRAFDMPEGYVLPDSLGLISEADILHNLSLTDSIVETVDREDLLEYVKLIPAAAEGETGEMQHSAYDAGSSTLAAFMYDDRAGAYQYVFLGLSGNWEQFNEAPEAKVLVSWLKNYGVFWLSD